LKFSAVTLGCKVNQYDTQMMRELLGLFWEEAREGEGSGLVVVNTCVVTAEAERQSRQALRRARRGNRGATVVAAGCLARIAGRSLVESGLADKVAVSATPEAFIASLSLPVPPQKGRGITGFAGRTRAFLKVQDGCDRRCTYCIVPLARGSSVSRSAEEVVSEAARLAAGGVPELVICGVRLNAYRDPGNGTGLYGLLSRVLDAAPCVRLRLSSVYPGKVEEGLLDLLTDHPRVCRHVHLPVQSGSEKILKAMGRGYRAADVAGLVARLRRRCPRIGLTADVIVGFPGESERDFGDTLGLVTECGFHQTHIFPFSPRPGTPAERMVPAVPDQAVRDRIRRLRVLDKELLVKSMLKMKASEAQVVVEKKVRDGFMSGLTDTYHRVKIKGTSACGGILRTRITGISGFDLVGVPAEGSGDE